MFYERPQKLSHINIAIYFAFLLKYKCMIIFGTYSLLYSCLTFSSLFQEFQIRSLCVTAIQLFTSNIHFCDASRIAFKDTVVEMISQMQIKIRGRWRALKIRHGRGICSNTTGICNNTVNWRARWIFGGVIKVQSRTFREKFGHLDGNKAKIVCQT